MLNPVPLSSGRSKRYDYEYEKRGSASVFGLLEPNTGQRHLRVTERRTKQDFARTIDHLLTELYPTATKVRLVLDNLNTHQVTAKGRTPRGVDIALAALYDTFTPGQARALARRLEFYFTPKHGSWLNAVELELAALTKPCPDRRIGSREEPTIGVSAWCHARNLTGSPIDWRFNTPTARQKLKRVYPELDEPTQG